MVSPDMDRRVNQLRHDVDDVFELLDATNKTVEAIDKAVAAIATTQRRHGNRLDEIQSSLDLTVGRLDRLEQSQQRLEQSQQRLEQGHQRLEQGHQSMAAKLDAILAALRNRPSSGADGAGQGSSVAAGGSAV